MKILMIPGRRLRLAAVTASLVLGAGPVGAASFTLPAKGQAVVGAVRHVRAGPDDTLSDLARRYDVGFREIRLANPGVDPWLPGRGRDIVLPTAHILPAGPRRGIVMNVPEMRLYYYPADGRQVLTFPVSIGRGDWATPLGETRVVEKITNPAWYPPASIRQEHAAEGAPLPRYVAPGPDNPLGQFALRLGLPGYLIHGTNRPYGIGMQVTHGCMRLYPEDISRLFHGVPVGTPVRIVHQRYKAGWRDGRLYLEVHPPLPGTGHTAVTDLTPVVRVLVAATRGEARYPVDWRQVQRMVRRPDGIPRAVGPVRAATTEAAATTAR